MNLLTPRQLADMLQMHPHTVYRLTSIPHIKVGRSVRYRAEDVRRYLEARVVSACPIPPKNDIIVLGGKEPMPRGKQYLNFGYGAVFVKKTKAGKARYYLDYKKVNGGRERRVCRHATCIEDAVDALKTAVSRRPHSKTISLAALASLYLDDFSKGIKRSYRVDKQRMEPIKDFFSGDIRDITPHQVIRFRQSRLTAGNSQSTSNRYLALLRRMLNVAIEEGYLETNPVSKIKFFSEKDTLKERILTYDEEAALLSVITLPYLRRAVLLSLYAGLRKGEILNLRWSNINADYTQIKVEHTKSGRYRIVPISSILRDDLRGWRDGEKVMGRNLLDFKRSWHSATSHCGITGVRFHDLRHTFASRLVVAGADIETVRQILGHSSLVVTQRYVHSGEAQRAEAVEKLSHHCPMAESKIMDDAGKYVN